MTALSPDAPGWRAQAIVPVLTVSDPGRAEAAVAALGNAGLAIVEITLRTPGALAAIRRIGQSHPGIVVGAGSILSPEDMTAAIDAGARFLVSPGQTDALLEAGLSAPVPFIPGTATPSEMMRAMAAGYRVVKFFPAEASGGAKGLAGMLAPLAGLHVMPTGGITVANVAAYLALPAVVACGGSWMAPPSDIEAGNVERITTLARAAAAMGRAR